MSLFSPSTDEDTICALASGIGGSIAVIRLSGNQAGNIWRQIWRPRTAARAISQRKLLLGAIEDGDIIVDPECLTVYMPKPHSYTGEDVVEFHCHGGALVSKMILALLQAHGARAAAPGEFTKRAFLNGRIDLTQAEAVQQMIASQSALALRVANRQLTGQLKSRIDAIEGMLIELLMEVEVRLDFVDENLDWHTPGQIHDLLTQALSAIEALLRSRSAGEILYQGIRLAIIGAPNAGKSSLLNLILGHNRAIVTDIPGTTRDTLEEAIQIKGIPIKIIDTAGIRMATDRIEQEGIIRSRTAMDQAQLLIWVIDLSHPLDPQLSGITIPTAKKTIIIANKIDLLPDWQPDISLPHPVIRFSALTAQGLEELYDMIVSLVWQYPAGEEPEVAVNARHGILLEQAQTAIRQAFPIIAREEYELLAIHLRTASDALGMITGRTIQPDILDHIFHRFCIGK